MIIKDKIPEQFYKLFRTKNMEHYMTFLTAIYKENNEVYTALGLTLLECRQIVAEQMGKNKVMWEPEYVDSVDAQNVDGKIDDNSESINSSDEESSMNEFYEMTASPTTVVTRLINWGWLRSDYDERINEYVISFPEYSQLYVELFEELQTDDSEKERESILSIYSSLFTYNSDKEKNNDIIKNALKTSRDLSQLLSNMQDSMRTYFDELSRRKDFIGIQEVLVKELNNSDSKKYAILTTTDSFYRYKEEIKELISKILIDNDNKKIELNKRKIDFEPDTRPFLKIKRMLEQCEEAGQMVYRVEREFDIIEKKYNKLIEQKTVFAKRALARIHYILTEGSSGEDNTLRLVSILNKSNKSNDIIARLSDKLNFSSQFKSMTHESLYTRKEAKAPQFEPVAVEIEEESLITDYVPKPLYTQSELEEFRLKFTNNGVFEANSQVVESVEDLEKLMFIWHEAINDEDNPPDIKVEEEVEANGFRFTKLTIQ